MRHKDEDRDVVKVNTKTEEVGPPPIIDVGIDLSEFYMSVEWDILQVPTIFNPATHEFISKLDRMVDRVKPWFMVHES